MKNQILKEKEERKKKEGAETPSELIIPRGISGGDSVCGRGYVYLCGERLKTRGLGGGGGGGGGGWG